MDYTDIGLTPQLNSVDSLAEKNKGTITTGYEFVTENERGAITKAFLGNAVIGTAQIEDASITTAKIANAAITSAKLGTAVIGTANIGTLSFNEISGGTATLGGTLNGNGVFALKAENGSIVCSMGTSGIIFQDVAGGTQMSFDGGDGLGVTISNLHLGGTYTNLGGGLDISDSGIRYSQVDVDYGLTMGTSKPIRLHGLGSGTPTMSGVALGTVNHCAIYMDAGGAGGKHRLLVKFETGNSVVLATEP